MFIFSILSIMISLILIMTSHPVSIMVAILTQTLVICLNIWIVTKTSWFSYTLFLIFIGGLMVLFVYIVSLASNEKFEPKVEISTSMALMVTFTTMIISALFFFQSTTSKMNNNLLEMTYVIFSQKMMWPTMMIMGYLLFALIVAVKISSKYEGSLRSLT